MADGFTEAPLTRQLAAAAPGLRALALQRLEDLVSAESPTGDPVLLEAVNVRLAEAYAATGAKVELVPGESGDHLVCSWPASGPPAGGHALLIGHSDTVFPAGTTEERPFRLQADGDTVTGPGVYDMKGGLVQVELAVRLLAATGAARPTETRLVVVSDEEIGSPEGRRVVAGNAVGARAVLGLEPPLADGGLKVGRRGVARYELAVHGVEAHAGLDPERGVSAIDELVDQLVALRGAVPAGPDAALNVGAVNGGTRANVVAGHATAEIGLRFGSSSAERRLLAALTDLCPIREGTSVHVTRLSHRPAWEADPSNPVVVVLTRLAAELGITLGTGVSGGAGDTNATGAAGIPTVDGLGPEGGGAHSPTEWASICSLMDRAVLLAGFLTEPAAVR